MTAHSPEKLPSQIGRYRIQSRLGRGAFGVVFRAYDPQLEREVALKVALPSTLGTARRVERFLADARSAARLRHPHIVAVHDAGQDGSVLFIASDFIDGRTLAAAMREGALGLRQRVEII